MSDVDVIGETAVLKPVVTNYDTYTNIVFGIVLTILILILFLIVLSNLNKFYRIDLTT
jgi:hypothetical protein